MEALINNNRKSLWIIRWCIQNPVKHLRWNFLISNSEHFILDVSKSYKYASNKTKQNHDALSFILQKSRTAICANLFSNSILSSLYQLGVRHYHNFNTGVLHFKLIHPYSWIHMILNSYYLPVQSRHNNYRLTFSNFFGESK